jgi:hypothetical protein
MKHPSTWNKKDLQDHLQHALNLELWTIPLYLTSLYSIKDLNILKNNDYPDAAKLILSVVVQEMLHIELVCNISNALGFSPVFVAPSYSNPNKIPFIHPAINSIPPDLRGYTIKPQSLNKQSLQLFCAIELPHYKNEIDWTKQKSYGSIAELYEALKIGIASLWNSLYVEDANNTKQKNTFNEYHNNNGKSHGFSQRVYSAETALKAIDAIIEQGEGADSKQVPADFRPPHLAEGKEYDVSWYKGNLSHYQKFRILLHSHHKLPPVFAETDSNKNTLAQENMKKQFLDFLILMQKDFNTSGDQMSDKFWREMFELGNAVTAVWESGCCPNFNFVDT